MTMPRMSINEEIKNLPDNKKGDYSITIDSIFFYEGIRKYDGNNARIIAKLVDYEGAEIDAIIWGNNWNDSGIYDYDDKFVARVKGYKETYNNNTQINVQVIEPIVASDDEYQDLIKVYTEYKQRISNEDKDQYVSELHELIESVDNKYYSRLLKDIFDEEMIAKFREWTAAWERHHAFPGGLLVHTVNVAKKCRAVAEISDVIDKDLLITAALLHDVAKVEEYDGFPSKRRLYKGRMLYHPYMGAEMVALKINEYKTSKKEEFQEVSDFPDNLEIQLKHCILSHHGLLEYGAAVKPMILEANILHSMDDADAKEQYFKERAEESKEFNANVEADKIRGYYNDFYKEYAYPTMSVESYNYKSHSFFFLDDQKDDDSDMLPFV